MNNEPVAWMNEEEIGIMYAMKIQGAKDWKTNLGLVPEENDIPLYTHPSEHDLGIAEAIGFEKGYKAATAKTLTDEEIEQIASKYLTAHAQFICAGECHYEGEIEFARAILKKANNG